MHSDARPYSMSIYKWKAHKCNDLTGDIPCGSPSRRRRPLDVHTRMLHYSPSSKLDESAPITLAFSSTNGKRDLRPVLLENALLRREKIVLGGLLRDVIEQPQTTLVIH